MAIMRVSDAVLKQQRERFSVDTTLIDSCVTKRGEGYVEFNGESECWRILRPKLFSLPKPEPRPPGISPTQPSGADAMTLTGPRLWEKLHRWAQVVDLKRDDPAFWLEMFRTFLPCGDCRQHWMKLLQEMPPDFTSNEKLFERTVEWHNKVNERIGKPVMSFAAARALWASASNSAG